MPTIIYKVVSSSSPGELAASLLQDPERPVARIDVVLESEPVGAPSSDDEECELRDRLVHMTILDVVVTGLKRLDGNGDWWRVEATPDECLRRFGRSVRILAELNVKSPRDSRKVELSYNEL